MKKLIILASAFSFAAFAAAAEGVSDETRGAAVSSGAKSLDNYGKVISALEPGQRSRNVQGNLDNTIGGPDESGDDGENPN